MQRIREREQELERGARLLREENDYLKAEMVGLKKEVDELKTKLKEERESVAKRVQEEVQTVKRGQEEQNGRKKPVDVKPAKKKTP